MHNIRSRRVVENRTQVIEILKRPNRPRCHGRRVGFRCSGDPSHTAAHHSDYRRVGGRRQKMREGAVNRVRIPTVDEEYGWPTLVRDTTRINCERHVLRKRGKRTMRQEVICTRDVKRGLTIAPLA